MINEKLTSALLTSCFVLTVQSVLAQGKGDLEVKYLDVMRYYALTSAEVVSINGQAFSTPSTKYDFKKKVFVTPVIERSIRPQEVVRAVIDLEYTKLDVLPVWLGNMSQPYEFYMAMRHYIRLSTENGSLVEAVKGQYEVQHPVPGAKSPPSFLLKSVNNAAEVVNSENFPYESAAAEVGKDETDGKKERGLLVALVGSRRFQPKQRMKLPRQYRIRLAVFFKVMPSQPGEEQVRGFEVKSPDPEMEISKSRINFTLEGDSITVSDQLQKGLREKLAQLKETSSD